MAFAQRFVWSMKRALIDKDSADEPQILEKLEHVCTLFSQGEFEQAVKELPPIAFEFSSDLLDEPENPYFIENSAVYIENLPASCFSLFVNEKREMYLTAIVAFTVDVKKKPNIEKLNDWLADNGGPFSATILGGFGFCEDDGCSLIAVA